MATRAAVAIRSAVALGAAVLALLGAGCFDVIALRPELRAAVSRRDALALADALEQLIDEGRASDSDREAAYDAVRKWRRSGAEYAFARAAIAGRLAQVRGLSAAGLVREMERLARESMTLDAKFRDGAARRMLGTLYVLAPAQLLEHGDSEEGLELLEKQAAEYPRAPQNHLRLAEGYLGLNDPGEAREPLCVALDHATELLRSERKLLATLIEQSGGRAELDCP